ncbi:FliM/FliN family flagellar motor switch protein [Paenirhodobacter populi]|uniref:Flagellar motor switch protein FliM n=1 Tax=Paenirhodobacter populi TaxID=2306993 RepID=A0A443JUB1_9RHOB|nr:FliM/FliN family flagellar motor switch protein [Sinirhodobacter populi]RWR24092.1 flagellar motor switch protein FliM [Sinirhodobacter populi]
MQEQTDQQQPGQEPAAPAPSVLRRMIRAAPAEDAAEPGPERAIGLAIAKAARDRLDLEIDVRSLTERRASLAELPELIENMSLLLLIEGPAEAMGLVVLPGPTLSAIVEVQTTGRIARNPPPPRKPTRMDAAMTVDLVDAVLAGIETELARSGEAVWASGFRYASYLDDIRSIGLLMEDVSYRVWTMRLAIGPQAVREGGLLWIVPEQGRAKPALPPQRPAAAPVPPDDATWAQHLEQAVMGSQAALDAVLHRVSMPLSAVMALRPGVDIPLPPDALARLQLEADGRAVATVRLGQRRGLRAVRLVAEDAPQEAPAPRSEEPDHEAWRRGEDGAAILRDAASAPLKADPGDPGPMQNAV